jgi:hypothetical protein
VQVHWDVLKGDPNANPEKQDKRHYAYEWLKPHDALASNRAKKPPLAWEGDGEFVLGDGSSTDACRKHITGLTARKLI